MKTLSAKGFAEFVLAGPSKKAQIVRNMLKPKSKEAQVIVFYYARAIRIIRLYHAKSGASSSSFLSRAALSSLATAPATQIVPLAAFLRQSGWF